MLPVVVVAVVIPAPVSAVAVAVAVAVVATGSMKTATAAFPAERVQTILMGQIYPVWVGLMEKGDKEELVSGPVAAVEVI